MRHSTILTAILSSLLVLRSIGCEEGEPYGKENSDTLTERKKAKAETSCDFDRAPLTLGDTYTVTIKNGNLKPLKEKDLLKKGYLVKIDVAGDVDSFDATVENQGTMVVSLSPDRAGPGTVSVFTVDKKKDKERITASCSFEVTESLEDTNGDAEGETDSCSKDDDCVENEVCEDNTCVAVECAVCTPEQECGTIDDGCGNTISCGDESDVCDTAAGETCGGAGVPNQCGSLPGGEFICQPCGETGKLNTKNVRTVAWPKRDALANDDPWGKKYMAFCYWIQNDIESCSVGPNVCGVYGPLAASFCGCVPK